jgi:hypothetical protein
VTRFPQQDQLNDAETFRGANSVFSDVAISPSMGSQGRSIDASGGRCTLIRDALFPFLAIIVDLALGRLPLGQLRLHYWALSLQPDIAHGSVVAGICK